MFFNTYCIASIVSLVTTKTLDPITKGVAKSTCSRARVQNNESYTKESNIVKRNHACTKHQNKKVYNYSTGYGTKVIKAPKAPRVLMP